MIIKGILDLVSDVGEKSGQISRKCKTNHADMIIIITDFLTERIWSL